MRVGYCVLHSQVAFVVQEATCAMCHPRERGSTSKVRSLNRAPRQQLKLRRQRRGPLGVEKACHVPTEPHARRPPLQTPEMNVATCRQLQEEALHSTLVVPRENHTVGGGHGCRFSCDGTARGRSSPLSATCRLHVREEA